MEQLEVFDQILENMVSEYLENIKEFLDIILDVIKLEDGIRLECDTFRLDGIPAKLRIDFKANGMFSIRLVFGKIHSPETKLFLVNNVNRMDPLLKIFFDEESNLCFGYGQPITDYLEDVTEAFLLSAKSQELWKMLIPLFA